MGENLQALFLDNNPDPLGKGTIQCDLSQFVIFVIIKNIINLDWLCYSASLARYFHRTQNPFRNRNFGTSSCLSRIWIDLYVDLNHFIRLVDRTLHHFFIHSTSSLLSRNENHLICFLLIISGAFIEESSNSRDVSAQYATYSSQYYQ
jgi:hypothetical protein